MPFSIFFFFFLILLFSTPLLLSSTPIPTHNRRALHQPFFPLPATPPAAQPSSPSFPNYPSTTNPQPFFPFYPSPPPPPPSSSSSLATFPANISSLIFPNSQSPPRRSSAKLLSAVLLPLLALSLLALTLAFFFFRRRRRRHSDDKPLRSNGHRLFPHYSVSSDGRKRSGTSGAAASSDFLYLGTLVGTRDRADEYSDEPPGIASPYRKLGSPDLHPLPPLSRQLRRDCGNAEGGGSSDEEFYSLRGSSAEKENPGGLVGGPESISRRNFPAVAVEKFASRSPTLSTPSYPSSNSASSPTPSSPVMSSPGRSTSKSSNTRSDDTAGVGEIGFRPTPPPLLRPSTPSPPKRKPTSHSPPSSLHEEDSDRNSRVSQFSGQILRSPARIGDFSLKSLNPFAAGPPERKPPPSPPRPPPPPPPPPPAGYWESRVQRLQASQPPVVGTHRSIGLKNSTAAVFPSELPDNDAMEKSEETPRPKLKPLHWDKVRASSDRAMVWDQLKSSSFKVNEEMIETLFVCNKTKTTPEEMNKRHVLPSPNQVNRVLDPKKSQNIAILLRALNVTKEEVCEALVEGSTDSFGIELLETLVKMAPTKEEELKLKEHKDDSPFKLGPAETFLKAVLNIPFAFKRVDAMLYIANFDSEVNYLRKSFETLEAACEELRSSRLFLKLLEAVLQTGNRMNVGTNRGGAHAFKLDTLLKLVDVKGTDGKTTPLHFVVQEIIRAEGSRLSSTDASSAQTQADTPRGDLELKKLGLKAVSGLGGELSNVKKAATMDSGVLNSYALKLAGGIEKISEVLRLVDIESSKESNHRFHEAMSGFLKKAEDEIIRVQAQESVALSLVKEIFEYFHGNSAKEEAHPFRIFMVVRDFLSILDRVCKEVGRIDDERSFVSSARQFQVSLNPTLLPLFPRFHALRPESSDDESSLSS